MEDSILNREFTEISEELNDRINSFLNMVIPPQNHMMGTCHLIWKMKKSFLRYGFNIDWETPLREESQYHL